MKGFVVKFNGCVCRAGVPKGVVSVSTTIRTDGSGNDLDHTIYVGGLKTPENNNLNWFVSDMKAGEEMEVEIAEFDEASLPLKEESHEDMIKRIKAIRGDNKTEQEYKLERFRELEKILGEKGLL